MSGEDAPNPLAIKYDQTTLQILQLQYMQKTSNMFKMLTFNKFDVTQFNISI